MILCISENKKIEIPESIVSPRKSPKNLKGSKSGDNPITATYSGDGLLRYSSKRAK